MVYSTNIIEGAPVVVIGVDGKLDDEYVPLVEGMIATGYSWVLVDLSKSQFIRGDHMEWMIETHHACDKAGGAYALTDVPKDFAYILSIMQLDQFFRCFDTATEGVRVFSEAAQRVRLEQIPSSDSLEDLEVLDLDDAELPGVADEGPQTGKRLSRREREAREREQRRQRVEMFIRHVAPGMSYLQVLEKLAKENQGTTRRIDPGQLAKASSQPRGTVSTVLERLIELRICVRGDGGDVVYEPGRIARRDVADFLRMWNDPRERQELRKMVFAEEQAAAASGGGGLLGKLKRLVGRG